MSSDFAFKLFLPANMICTFSQLHKLHLFELGLYAFACLSILHVILNGFF